MKLAYEIFLPSDTSHQDKTLPPVILLHGRMDSKKTWKRFAPTIAEKTGREVYTIDLRNHGDSPWSDEMTIQVLVDDLEEFMDDQDIPQAALVGHSLGGRTAMLSALRKPEAVECLFVEDMVTTMINPAGENAVQQMIALMRESLKLVPPGADEEAAKRAVIKFLGPKIPKSKNAGKDMKFFNLENVPLKRVGDTYAWQGNLDVLETMMNSKQAHRELTGEYRGDAYFLYGTESFFDVKNDENICKLFPCAVKVPLHDAGHLIHHEYPQEFLKAVLDFLLTTRSS